MQIKEEDQLGNVLCWVRLGHHMVLMKLSLAEVAVVNGGGGGAGASRTQTSVILKEKAGCTIYP